MRDLRVPDGLMIVDFEFLIGRGRGSGPATWPGESGSGLRAVQEGRGLREITAAFACFMERRGGSTEAGAGATENSGGARDRFV